MLTAKALLARMGRLPVPPDGFTGSFDQPLENALQQFQADRSLLVDGTMAPGGETERNMERELGARPKEPPLGLGELDLKGPVGNGSNNDINDL